MACLKGVSRSASVALAPDSPYLAAGTMAGAVDLAFSSTANLEIFKLDFQSDDYELPIVGEIPCTERFNRLSWGKNGSGSESFSLGLIAGGLVDGSIDIWNPLSLIRSDDTSQGALVGHLTRHRGPVRGLEFNALSPNLLASGDDDGEICIWDLANPAEPSHFPPLRGTTQGEISFLSWNSKVQHILASTSYNGTTAIWDLKKQKQVISFTDSIRRRCSVLQWNPDVTTQLVIASDEDGSPALRLWDMRNTMAPLREFSGHTKGVIAMSWCPNDSSYLVTCAKDSRTICWDTVTGEIVCELPAGTNWNFDVHWYPKIPGVIAASSFDGKIGVYNIEGCSRSVSQENDFTPVSLRAPKWYKRPVGASFGFGGKLVSCRPAGKSSEVFVHSIVMEDSLVSRSSEFEAAIQNGERSSLRVLCDNKSQQSESAEDRETWGFLKVMFEEDGTARTKLLTHLGFSIRTEEKENLQDDTSQESYAFRLEDSAQENLGNASNNEAAIFTDNGEDFFSNLPSPKAETPLATSDNNFSVETAISAEEIQQEPDVTAENTDSEFDDAVQRALVVGDYKGAVAQCIAANKMADALVIAHSGGESLWEATRDQYLKTQHSPYLKVVAAIKNKDLLSHVNTRPLKFWKETLALLCSFAQGGEWTVLCDTLASKLMTAGNTLAATLCYICAGNIDKTVDIWSRSLTTEHEGKSYVVLLQDLMEKTIVLALASGQKRFSASLCKLVEIYAEILASQGLLTTAMEYLKLLGSDELTPELCILRDRIALSTEPQKETKAVGFEDSQLQTGLVYNTEQLNLGRNEPAQNYYQETAPLQLQQTVPGSQYSENYQPTYEPSYARGYGAPPPYQPAPQPQIFRPSQPPQVSQATFAPPPTAPQPAVRTFVPSTPQMLRNAEQYQQPTLGSQLYPGTANPSYPVQQPGPHSMVTSQGLVPTNQMPPAGPSMPRPQGFVPVNNAAVIQRPGMGPMQSLTPTQPSAIQPAVAPAAPPPTIQTVDTSNVPAHQRPVVTTLTRLYNETSEALGGSRANPAKKREIEDNSRKIGALFAKLNSGDISQNAGEKLVHLCQALDNGDYATALQIQVLLTTSEWDECNFWLATIKRVIKTRQSMAR